jgi:hypothetical protein
MMDCGVIASILEFEELNRQDAKVAKRRKRKRRGKSEKEFKLFLSLSSLCVFLANLASWRFNSSISRIDAITQQSIMSLPSYLGTGTSPVIRPFGLVRSTSTGPVSVVSAEPRLPSESTTSTRM